MNRRSFLAAAGGAWLVPDWLARAFAPSGEEPQDQKASDDRRAQLRGARRAAEAHGKPLLVLLVPEQASERWTRGSILGTFLNHAGDDALCDVALCELVCATAAEVREVLGKVAIEGEPLMLLVEPGTAAKAEPPRSQSLGAEFLEPPAEPVVFPSGPDALAAEEKGIRDRNARLAKVLHAAVAADRGALAARADAGRATLSEADRAALEQLFAGERTAPADLLVRAAAVVCMTAEAPRTAGDRQRLRQAVANAARAVFVAKPVAGARWATSQGCGFTVEGDADRGLAVACGMGHVPELGRRFLHFATQD